MTDGEKMIWASAFAAAIGHGSKDAVAVMLAARAVQRFRAIDAEQLAGDEREQVETIRWPGSDGEVLALVKKTQARAGATIAQSAKIQALAVDLTAERDALQLEVERIGRVKTAAPETLHLALREADGELERLRKVLADVRDDLEEDAPVSALARLAEVLG